MTIHHYYIICAACFAGYTLGLMHGKGHTHWRNCAAALLTGMLWPVALCYGIYTAHFTARN